MKYLGIGGAIVVVLAIIFSVKAKGGAVPEFTSTNGVKKNLIQSVDETGTVEADVKVDFGWEKSGRVVQVQKKVGDSVKKGDVLASFDATQERNNLAQSVAYLRSAEANLNLKFAGPTDQNLQSSLSSVEKARAGVLDAESNLKKVELSNMNAIQQAERALQTAENNLRSSEGGENSQIVNDAYEDLVNALKSAATTLGDAVIQADNILGVDNQFANDDFEDMLGRTQSSYIDIAKSSYLVAKTATRQSEIKVTPLYPESSHTDIDEARVQVETALLAAQRNLTDVKNVLGATISGNNLTATELATLKSTIIAALSEVNTASTNIINSVQAVGTARNSLTSYKIAFDKATQDLQNTKEQSLAQHAIAEANLTVQKANLTQAEASHEGLVAKPREVDVAALRAEVSRNRASVAQAQNELNKTQLRALADGVISKLDVEVGQTVAMNTPVATILSSGLAIKVDISESDIAKVQVHDSAMVTLDALGDDMKFTATVASIEPAETKVSGVVYYKTTLVLEKNDQIANVRPGMTANVSILTDQKENVLVIPQRAIIEQDGKKTVRVVIDKKKGKFEMKDVTTGLKGDNGEIEITSGLQENEEIVTFLKENK